MPKHHWSIVCQRVIVDKFTNNLTIVGVIDKVHFDAQRIGPKAVDPADRPVAKYDFSIVSYWTRSEPTKEEEATTRIRLLSPKGTAIGLVEQKVDLRGEILRARNISNWSGVPISESGDYQAHIQLSQGERWKTVGSVSVSVKITVLPSRANPKSGA